MLLVWLAPTGQSGEGERNIITSNITIRPVKKQWWGTGMVICLERDADLHMAQLMPLPLTVSCFSKIQIGFTFLVPAHPGSPGKIVICRLSDDYRSSALRPSAIDNCLDHLHSNYCTRPTDAWPVPAHLCVTHTHDWAQWHDWHPCEEGHVCRWSLIVTWLSCIT